MTLEILVLFAALSAIGLIAVWTVLTGSPPTPTSPQVRRTILACLPPRLPRGSGQMIYELGMGWGGLAIAVARRYPDSKVIGFELSPLPWLIAHMRAMAVASSNFVCHNRDFLKADLSDAAIVVCYLSSDVLEKLKPKLERELPVGALVISSTFAVPGWAALDTVIAKDIYRSPVYLYEMQGVEPPA